MHDTLLKFARAFARFKTILSEQPAGDLRLQAALDFWPTLASKNTVPAYQTYFDEYLALVVPLVTLENLSDFTLDELGNLRSMLIDAGRGRERVDINDCVNVVILRMAEMYFFAGDIENGLTVCRDLPDVGDVALPNNLNASKNEFEALAAVHDFIRETNPALNRILNDIRNRWESVRDAFYHDRVACLFIDKNSNGKVGRGRLKVLKGTVEYFGKSAPTDEITLDSQLKSPDDPFVGVIYDSLEAIRGIFRNLNYKSAASSYYHAHFSLGSNGQAFTGDSIGLATGLITYCQLLKPEVLRTERFISAEIACTGSVEADGRVHAVNKETLAIKVERAFFSPMRFVALPRENLGAAQECLDALRQQYPRRRLNLIGVEHIRDAIENRNILRDERVCIGEFVGRKAAKYSRSIKVQVPMLLVLAYLLVSLLYPKAWLFFDWNPQYVRINTDGFTALNADSIKLWAIEYDCDDVREDSKYCVGDLNSDGSNEVAFIPNTAIPDKYDAMLFVYNKSGGLCFSRDCVIQGEYPGDTTRLQDYSPHALEFLHFEDTSLVFTSIDKSYPARQHFIFWDISGDEVGWYISAGQSLNDSCIMCIDSVFYVLTYNNRLNRAVFYGLVPIGCKGASPPYQDNDYDLEGVVKGTQLCYIVFPRSELINDSLDPYHRPFRLKQEDNKTIEVSVCENRDNDAILNYYVNQNHQVTGINANDYYYALFENANPQNNVENRLRLHLDSLFNHIQYWSDSGFVCGRIRKNQ